MCVFVFVWRSSAAKWVNKVHPRLRHGGKNEKYKRKKKGRWEKIWLTVNNFRFMWEMSDKQLKVRPNPSDIRKHCFNVVLGNISLEIGFVLIRNTSKINVYTCHLSKLDYSSVIYTLFIPDTVVSFIFIAFSSVYLLFLTWIWNSSIHFILCLCLEFTTMHADREWLCLRLYLLMPFSVNTIRQIISSLDGWRKLYISGYKSACLSYSLGNKQVGGS